MTRTAHPNRRATPGLRFSPRLPTYRQKNEPRDTVNVPRADRTWNPVASLPLGSDANGFLIGVVTKHKLLDFAASKHKPVTLSCDKAGLTVEVRTDYALTATADGKLSPIRVAAADLRGLLLLLNEVRPGVVELAIDSTCEALRWSWRSPRAQYELFMPTASATGGRVALAFKPIAITAPAAAKKAA